MAAPERAVDIMDLPPARSTGGTGSAPSPSGIRLVSATEELDGPLAQAGRGRANSSGAASATEADSFSPRARYGYDPEYGWLRGRLEYSEIDRRWKLRYVPIDGDTDRFGGSVVLTNPSALDGYEAGEFVEVRGTLGPQAEGDHGFAPPFEVREMQRLGG
jgi:hypothetical protein